MAPINLFKLSRKSDLNCKLLTFSPNFYIQSIAISPCNCLLIISYQIYFLPINLQKYIPHFHVSVICRRICVHKKNHHSFLVDHWPKTAAKIRSPWITCIAFRKWRGRQNKLCHGLTTPLCTSSHVLMTKHQCCYCCELKHWRFCNPCGDSECFFEHV